jgi:hypothetical protein
MSRRHRRWPRDARSAICDVRPTPEGTPNVEFAFDADGPRFVEMLVDILGR